MPEWHFLLRYWTINHHNQDLNTIAENEKMIDDGRENCTYPPRENMNICRFKQNNKRQKLSTKL